MYVLINSVRTEDSFTVTPLCCSKDRTVVEYERGKHIKSLNCKGDYDITNEIWRGAKDGKIYRLDIVDVPEF